MGSDNSDEKKSLLFYVVIAGLLMVVAALGFRKLQQRHKQSEADRNLRSVYNMQVEYYKIHDRYAETFEELGWEPAVTPEHYCIFLTDKEIVSEGCSEVIPPNTTSAFANVSGFRVVAIGNLDGDDTLDVNYIDNDNNLVKVVDDTIN